MTAALQMIRADVDMRGFRRWMGSRRLQDPDHALHCLLTECFGDFAPQPFRLMAARGAGCAVLYGYGCADADALRDEASVCADPLQSGVIPAAGICSKPMPTEWRLGRRLGFAARIRPITRPSRNAASFAGKECDAFLWEALRYPKGKMLRSREEVYGDWLARRIADSGGAELDGGAVKMVAFQRGRAVRKRRGGYSEGPDAVMRGTLVVRDSDKFAALLARGVGRHRAYGYGMLLLRPARGAAAG